MSPLKWIFGNLPYFLVQFLGSIVFVGENVAPHEETPDKMFCPGRDDRVDGKRFLAPLLSSSIKTSPGCAPEFAKIFCGWTVPTTANPKIGSSLLIV